MEFYVPVPTLAIEAIWGVNQGIEHLSLYSLYLSQICLLNKQDSSFKKKFFLKKFAGLAAWLSG